MTSSERPDRQLVRRTWQESLSRFIPDGRKQKLNSIWVKALSGILVVFILSMQIFRTSGPVQMKTDEGLDIPTLAFSDQSQLIYKPRVYQSVSELESDLNRKRSQSGKIAINPEPLKIISLSGLTEIPTGSEVNAVLVSGATNGTLTASLVQNLIIDGETVLPSRTVLFGKGSSSDERLYVRFTKAILPDKKEIKIVAEAFDQKDRMLGLKGKKVSDYAFKIAASSGLIFLGAMADGMQEEGGNPFAPKRRSARDAALGGVATASLEQGKNLMESMNNQSRIEVKAQTPVVILFGDNTSQE